MLDQATAHVPVNLPVNAVGVPNGKVVRPPFQVPIRLSNQARDRLKAPRAAPNHPGRPSGSLPVASPPVSGFILVGGLAPSVFLSRPNRVYFILRLACFAHTNASPDELLHPALAGYMFEQAIYMVNSFEFTRSARLILAYRPSGSVCGEMQSYATLS